MPYLYAVQMLIPDYIQPVKIGFSVAPEIRVQSYSSEPFPVRWMGSWAVTDRTDETSVHRRFVNYRMAGEWFFPAPILLHFINTQLKRPDAIVGRDLVYTKRAKKIQNAQRWNLARLAAESGVAPWLDESESAEWLSSTFDRSAVSHEALKGTWRI